MAKKIDIVGKSLERINVTGRSLRRVEPAEFAAALGAEPSDTRPSGPLDLISLAKLGNDLIQRLRSTGGRPSLEGATEKCKVPLTPDDVAALTQVADAIEQKTGARPALGQVASVMLRTHLESLKAAPGDPSEAVQP
jgi:hypothetical protein